MWWVILLVAILVVVGAVLVLCMLRAFFATGINYEIGYYPYEDFEYEDFEDDEL